MQSMHLWQSCPLNYKNTPKGRNPTFCESYKCTRNETPLWGPVIKRKRLLGSPVQTSVSFISTALKFTGTPGRETWCSETLKVKMGTTDFVYTEKTEPFANPHIRNSEIYIASSFFLELSQTILLFFHGL